MAGGRHTPGESGDAPARDSVASVSSKQGSFPTPDPTRLATGIKSKQTRERVTRGVFPHAKRSHTFKETRQMKKWTLATLEGVNPNTARTLFEEVSGRYPSVSYGRFRNETGRTLACFDADSRWIPGDLFRDYFATRPAAGALFVQRYNEKLRKRAENANAYESESERKRSTRARVRVVTLASLAAQAARLAGRIAKLQSA